MTFSGYRDHLSLQIFHNSTHYSRFCHCFSAKPATPDVTVHGLLERCRIPELEEARFDEGAAAWGWGFANLTQI